MSSRYDPFEEMERFFEQTRRAMGASPRRRMLGSGEEAGSQEDLEVLSPGDANLGLEATEDGYAVTADLPGFEREDIDLRFADGVLTIRGQVDVTDEADGAWHRRSRRVHERLSVPGTVVEDEISASYRNGVLEVRLPTEDEPADDEHRIEID